VTDLVEADVTHIDFNRRYAEPEDLQARYPDWTPERFPGGMQLAIFWTIIHESQNGNWQTFRPYPEDGPGTHMNCIEDGWTVHYIMGSLRLWKSSESDMVLTTTSMRIL
jgi:hypothetical protein